MMEKKYFISLFLIVILLKLDAQQDQMYTQYMFNKLALNPGFAGNEKYLGATFLIRDQWNGIPGAPEAQVLSVNLPRIGERVGIGFNLRRQSIGISKSTTISGIYAYKFALEDGILSMGIEVSGRNLVTDFTDSRLIATQGLDIDPSIPRQTFNNNILNVGYGLYFNTNRYYVGASIPRLIKADLDFDNNNFASEEVRHMYIMGGAAWPINRDLSMSAQSLVKLAENSPFDVDMSLSLTFNEKYTTGLSYRFGGTRGDVGESIDLLFSFQLTNQFMLGFSHDFTLSGLRKFDSGSIEAVAHYAFGKKENKVIVINPRYF